MDECYKCEYRRGVAGSCHSSCGFNQGSDATSAMSSPTKYKALLEIKGNQHGIDSGWFYWPYNFDPVWLEKCNGFKKKGGPDDEQSNDSDDSRSKSCSQPSSKSTSKS